MKKTTNLDCAIVCFNNHFVELSILDFLGSLTQNNKIFNNTQNLLNKAKFLGDQPSGLSSFTVVISVPDFDKISLIQVCLLRTLIVTFINEFQELIEEN